MTAAVSGSARFVICEPNAVTVSEVHSFTKLGLCQSPLKVRFSVSLSRDMVACSFRLFPAMPERATVGRHKKGQADGCCNWFPPAAWREIQPGDYGEMPPTRASHASADAGGGMM